MAADIARDSVSAWAALCAMGGLEPDGRDQEFVDTLKAALRPSAASLNEALSACSTDDLVREFFQLAQPFVEMFRSILNFFQAAGVREGRTQWNIQIDEEHFDLRHFQRFFEVWDSLESALDVPAIDETGAWSTRHAEPHRRLEIPRQEYEEYRRKQNAPTGLSDVDLWIEAYDNGEYLAFPDSLHPTRLCAPLNDAAAVAMATNEVIRRHWLYRETMLDEYRTVYLNGRRHREESDGFEPWIIAQRETDHWLRSNIRLIALYMNPGERHRDDYFRNLAGAFGKYPRRKIGIRADWPDIKRVLSMPLWKKRHELYAVWIATEIVSALDGHDIELHHEEGKITFAFRETNVATIHSTRPKIHLYAERRSPLATPVGDGRTANVQPDYTIWQDVGPAERCGLVIEVKHYKKDAPDRFKAVLTDYARAHLYAQVVLVNHGPAKEAYEVDADVQSRCHPLGDLTTNNLTQREQFQKFIRDYVGKPLSAQHDRPLSVASLVAVDVSGSMSMAIHSPEFVSLLDSLLENSSAEVALIDTEIRHTCTIETVGETLRNVDMAGSTDLFAPIRDLLAQAPRILLITDADGLAGLGELNQAYKEIRHIGGIDVSIVEVLR